MRNLEHMQTVERWADFPDTPGDPNRGVFGMAKLEMEKLRASIKASNGAVTILVHPYYGSTDRFESRIARFIQDSSRETGGIKAPIFVFEEDHKVMQTDGRLYGLAPQAPVYIVPTDFSSGVPVNAENDEVAAWGKVVGLFKRLNVKKIFVGGMDYHGTNNADDGCVDQVIAALRDKFDIEVMQLTYPEIPKKKGLFWFS